MRFSIVICYIYLYLLDHGPYGGLRNPPRLMHHYVGDLAIVLGSLLVASKTII